MAGGAFFRGSGGRRVSDPPPLEEAAGRRSAAKINQGGDYRPASGGAGTRILSHYYERGWISLHGLEAAQKMYDEYHRLGGNGTVTKLMEDLKELPVRDKLAVMQEQQEQEEAEAKD